jgi:N-acetylneuraminate synthase
MSVFIIAEAGVNHNGDLNLAKKLVDAAVYSGANAVKFQTWKTELLVTKEAVQAKYQEQNTGVQESQFDMLKKLELPYNDFIELKKYCDELGIIFMSTPDELTSADFLYNLQDVFKIGSGELTNLPYLRHIGSFDKKIILSTGMGTMDEVKVALKTLIKSGTTKKNITILHANTQYPTPMEDVNLNAMISMRDELGVNIGYSDHTLGSEVSVSAVALGAVCIEKHITLDCSMSGPDHKSSINPNEFSYMVKAIRNIEKALGSKIKQPSPSEEHNIKVVRKVIVASNIILKGEVFGEHNITAKRSGLGITPMLWDSVVGCHAKRDFKVDEPIDL